ncbi:serine hydrolase domain-containing protein [Duganella aceris]|uniref:Serine hydrolase n=1 Tax=Duganella aceris TaxID=2703883 RepID=A0ABX0FNV2_9BURK|nr:serine hydrolase domain-containing protein [Duganella aceris]NGZ86173.1 serine hydrolase [Duganella aceris]
MNARSQLLSLFTTAAVLCACAVPAASAQKAPTDLVAAPVPGAAVPANVAPAVAAHPLEAADLTAWLDGRVPYALKTGDIAGLTLVVVKDGKVLLQKGYGYADVAAKVKMDPEQSLVRPGSTSKPFTWTAVMQLVEKGKIDLDRNVNDYLDFKIEEKFGKPITMRHLMNHRAGFEEGLKDLLSYDPARSPTTERYLKDHPRPMLFEPGKVPGYSNYGVALAGYIVQRVSGEPFEAYVDRHIFQPLGMRHSTFAQPVPKNLPGLMSKGYDTASGPPSEFEMVITAPAGSLTTTAADMSRFMLAHLQQGSLDGAQILTPATTALMHSPTEDADPGFGVMAHGLFHESRNGHKVIGHGGDTIVYHTEMQLLPDDGVGIFFTYNSRGKDAAVYAARKELFDGFMDRYFPAPPSVQPPTLASAATDARRIAGRYEGSRRVEHGFLTVLYLLQQTVITANPDGTVSAPEPTGGSATYHEVGPQLWREVGGTQLMALKEIDGVKTVINSDNPISVLQEASFARSAPLNLTLLVFSTLVLLATLAAWPLGALMRRADRATSGASVEQRRLRRVQRIAVAVSVVYLLAWFLLIKPVLSTDVGVYSYAIDWLVGLLEVSGLLALASAGAGVWAAWRMFRIDASGLARCWSVVAALALLGVVWLGVVGQLITWNLNY